MSSINLNELTLENLGQWPVAVKICVLLGVSLLIIALGYWLIIQDNFSQYNKLKGQEETLKTDFENKQRQLYNLPAYREQLQVMNERFVLMLKQLPEKNEMPGLLEEISKTGVASGLKFELFAPQPEVMHDFYVELPIKISVVGTYFQLAMFISRVAEMNRIVTLHDFNIEGVSSKDHKVVSEDELEMSITAKIYRYRTQ
ncbi:Tfp pilus assembly protein PilO [Legionella steigerwaltii]|uniref:Tfp pilus assembly protein PilO n=1 Tax=Legionella steigerwaltii TaxID=460 RepID=A0A378LCN0_9GAMM|nr:type 4a pilus biogenesis protein PilO [Legionella steigerwaltii]KTD79027.1 Tfp pilus assembly protein PilO [Legionella steigerwaltii]STY23618.1 Tfp pilus assembly protein PilO [Legionella steigerwaltii]